jgi:hypothetical protein
VLVIVWRDGRKTQTAACRNAVTIEIDGRAYAGTYGRRRIDLAKIMLAELVRARLGRANPER